MYFELLVAELKSIHLKKVKLLQTYGQKLFKITSILLWFDWSCSCLKYYKNKLVFIILFLILYTSETVCAMISLDYLFGQKWRNLRLFQNRIYFFAVFIMKINLGGCLYYKKNRKKFKKSLLINLESFLMLL